LEITKIAVKNKFIVLFVIIAGTVSFPVTVQHDSGFVHGPKISMQITPRRSSAVSSGQAHYDFVALYDDVAITRIWVSLPSSSSKWFTCRAVIIG